MKRSSFLKVLAGIVAAPSVAVKATEAPVEVVDPAIKDPLPKEQRLPMLNDLVWIIDPSSDLESGPKPVVCMVVAINHLNSSFDARSIDGKSGPLYGIKFDSKKYKVISNAFTEKR